MGLAEDDINASRSGLWLRRAGIALLIGLAVTGMVLVIKNLANGAKAPRHQVAKISLVPDTPPPPPPPKEQPKEPPKPVEQKEMQIQPLKPVETPPQQTEQVKMEGAAGDGPSPFAAGKVSEERIPTNLGQGGGTNGLGRAEFNVYLNRLHRLLQEELARNKKLKRDDYRIPANIYLADDGHVRSVELTGSTGQADTDEILRSELLRLLQKEPPPASAPSSFVVRVTNRILN